jgi:hypothetical protein
MPASRSSSTTVKQRKNLESASRALHDGQALRTFDIQQGLAPLKRVDRVLGLQRAQGLFLDLGGAIHGEVALAFEHQRNACADRPDQHTSSAGNVPDLPIQRPVAEPVVQDVIQPGAEKEDQVAEKVAGEQENGPGFGAVERGIAIPQHDRPHLAHQEPSEQRARQQDGEESIRPMKSFWGSKFMSAVRYLSVFERRQNATFRAAASACRSQQSLWPTRS